MASKTTQKTVTAKHSTAEMLEDAGKHVEPCAKSVLERLDRIIWAGECGRREDDEKAKRKWRRFLAHVNF